MELTTEQVLALAPDAASASAGKKLANPRSWKSLGQSTEAVWGECQGSALYQVRVDVRDMTTRCSCPSRKFPCKHSIGLLLLATGTSEGLPQGAPPDWVEEWLGKRAVTAAKREERGTSRTKPTEADPVAQAKRADKRLSLVKAGLDTLDLWMNDLIRSGLASVETQSATFWEREAARMVDAQAPGIAARLRLIAGIPNATPDWPERLLAELGRLALLTHAFRRLDALDPAMQEDVRQLIGWSLKEDEVVARGEAVRAEWVVLGQWVEGEERLRTQRTWLISADGVRTALVLQFSAVGAPLPQMIVPGTCQQAELVYWPGAYPQRALLKERTGNPAPLAARLPGRVALDDALTGVAQALGRQPWLDRFPFVLADVIPVPHEGQWQIEDQTGARLPLTRGDHWRLLALSGGAPVDLAGEWNGTDLLPLGVVVDNAYHPLGDTYT